MNSGLSDIEIREISIPEAEKIFEEHMKKDFPPEELKPFSRMLSLREEGVYLFYGIYADDVLSGYAFIVDDGSGGKLLDYLAVFDNMRGSGIGSRFLAMLPEETGPFSYMIIEVEDPGKSSSEEDRKLRMRRIGFYEKAGVYMTGIRTVVYDADYAVMLYTPGKRADDFSARQYVEHMYHVMFSDDVFDTRVEII